MSQHNNSNNNNNNTLNNNNKRLSINTNELSACMSILIAEKQGVDE